MGISENTVRRDWHFANANFLTGTGPRIRNYGPNDYRTRDLMSSKGFGVINQQIKQACQAGKTAGPLNLSTPEGYMSIPYDTFHSPVGGQVGGYNGTWSTSNGTTQINIVNYAGVQSFFYHAVNDRTGTRGPFRAIKQTFTIKEPSPCGKIIPIWLMVSLCGCEAIKNENDVYGSYELTSRDGRVLLEVGADHSYSETVRSSSAPDQKNSGRWQWRDGRVCFDALLVPRSVMKILEEIKPQVVGDAYQLDYCIPAVREYSKTMLELNPDTRENFVKVSSVGPGQ